MSRRLFRGRAFSENGWPYVDQGSCTWIRVPGAEHVSLQIQNGAPLQILRAFAADYHAHVEPLRDADSACWTQDNSVATSNHPGGTSMDLNWNGPDGKTFRYGIPKERAFPGRMSAALDELYDFYEGIVFCGGEWSIQDWMHHQLRAGTYDQKADRPTAKVEDFIRRKIRPDGFSTFKRGEAPIPAPAPRADHADVLARATGLSYARSQVIYPTIRDGLIQADCTNTNRIAMFLAQTGHESDNFQATAEYASGDAYDTRTDLGNTPQVDGDGRLYKGRTYIMITGKDNYRDFSRWAHGRSLVPTPTYFVDHPVELSELKWAGIGAAWYWVVERPDINALSDRRDLRTVTYRINGGYNGYEDRERRYNRALSLGDQLLTLIQGEDDFLSALNPGEQRLLFDKTLQVWGALFNQVRSKSGYRDPNGSLWAVKDYVHNMDGFIHEDYVEREAKRGNPAELARVVRSARGQGEDRSPEFIARAQRVLTEIERDTPEILDRFIEEGVGL